MSLGDWVALIMGVAGLIVAIASIPSESPLRPLGIGGGRALVVLALCVAGGGTFLNRHRSSDDDAPRAPNGSESAQSVPRSTAQSASPTPAEGHSPAYSNVTVEMPAGNCGAPSEIDFNPQGGSGGPLVNAAVDQIFGTFKTGDLTLSNCGDPTGNNSLTAANGSMGVLDGTTPDYDACAAQIQRAPKTKVLPNPSTTVCLLTEQATIAALVVTGIETTDGLRINGTATLWS